MHFDGIFREIGAVDPRPLARAIENLGDAIWTEYADRQQTYQPHRHTQTIPLIFDDDGRHNQPTNWPRLVEFEPMLAPVMDRITAANRPLIGPDTGYFIRVILTRLAAGTDIAPHRDDGYSLKRSHRNHFAISTNPLVEFEVDGQVKHLAAGAIWEINNRQKHAVRNLSDQPRVHMILDYVVPGEIVRDPDGLVIA